MIRQNSPASPSPVPVPVPFAFHRVAPACIVALTLCGCGPQCPASGTSWSSCVISWSALPCAAPPTASPAWHTAAHWLPAAPPAQLSSMIRRGSRAQQTLCSVQGSAATAMVPSHPSHGRALHDSAWPATTAASPTCHCRHPTRRLSHRRARCHRSRASSWTMRAADTSERRSRPL